MTKFSKSLLAATLAIFTGTAGAFPNKPVTMVVPYAVGGSTDVIARIVAEAMARSLGESVIVENAGGGGGTIGTSKVVRAVNDGHTILLHNMGIATAPAFHDKLAFNATVDLVPIALVGDVPMILVANKQLAPTNVADLITYMRSRPADVKFSHAGVGATSHLCAMLLSHTAEATVTMVPYRGTGPALQDLIAGNVDMICDQPVATSQRIRAGTLKAYAVASTQRLPILPEVPTFAESGLPGFELSVWHGLYAPKGTPPAVIDRLNAALRTALADAGVAKRLVDLGVVIPDAARLTQGTLSQHTAAETQRWGALIKKAGVKND